MGSWGGWWEKAYGRFHVGEHCTKSVFQGLDLRMYHRSLLGEGRSRGG